MNVAALNTIRITASFPLPTAPAQISFVLVSVGNHKFDPPDLDSLIKRPIEIEKSAKIIDHLGLLIALLAFADQDESWQPA